MLDLGSPQFDTPPPVVGENLIRAELNASEQARIQSDMDWSIHVISGLGDKTIPPMVELLQYAPQRVEEASKYYGIRDKTVKYKVVSSQIEELWKQGPITSRVKLSDDLEIEPLQTNYGVVTALIGGETIKIAYSSDCDLANIAQAVQACQKGKEIAAQFGLEEANSNHILLITSQLPLVDSHYNPFDNVTHVGCKGIKNFEQSDELAGVAHEETHANFDGTLQKYYKMSGSKRSEYYPWENTLEFIDEGLAVTAQQAILDKPAVAILKANFKDMHPILKDQLRQSKYDEQWLYNYTKSKENGEKSIDPVFRSDLHARYLPGAFVEYCLAKGYKLQDFMRVMLDKLNQVKPEIAKALDIEDQAVVLDHEQLLFIVMDKMGIPRTERKDHLDLEDKVYAEMERARLTPFQIVASLEGINEEQVINEFLKWIEKQDTDLTPNSPQEKILWTELEQADKPIVTLLKRINKIVAQQFPQANIQTEGSCSGHITPDGNLYTEEDSFKSGQTNQRESQPSIVFETTSQQREQILGYIRSLLKPAVEAVNNNDRGKPVLGYDEWIPDYPTHGIQFDRYSIGFYFPVLEKTSVYDILVDFWSQVDKQLSTVDNRKTSTLYTQASFFPKSHK